MAAEQPPFSYPDETHILTQARDGFRRTIKEFVELAERLGIPQVDTKGREIASRANNLLNNPNNGLIKWSKDILRPDDPQKNNEVISMMQAYVALVQDEKNKEQLNKFITEKAQKQHTEFDAAYKNYYQHMSHSGIIRPLTSSTGHLVTVDMQNRIAHGPRGPGGFEAAIAMGKTTEIFKEFDSVQTYPPPSPDRLANSDMTGWAQRKKTSQEIILLLKANLLPLETMKVALPFLTKSQQAEIAKELEAYNKRAHDHQDKKSQRIAATQSTPVTPTPDLAATTSTPGATVALDPAAPTAPAAPAASSPSASPRPGSSTPRI